MEGSIWLLGIGEGVDPLCWAGFWCDDAFVDHLTKPFFCLGLELYWDLSLGMLYRFYAGICSYSVVSGHVAYHVK